MKKNLRKMLPLFSDQILNGGIYQQRKTCRTPNCKCTRGKKHIAYYFFTRINGKLTKTYVRKSEINEFSNLVNQAKTGRKRLRCISEENAELLREFHNSLREKQSFINSLKGDSDNG
jgi:hypothetical protein